MGGGRRKAFVVGAGLVLLAVFGVTGIVLKHPLIERWYLYRLESENLEGKKIAAERLGQMGSVRAIPAIVEVLRTMSHQGPHKTLWFIEPDQFQHMEIALNEIGMLNLSGRVWDLQNLGTETREALVVPVDPDVAFFSHVLQAIATTAPEESVPYLVDALRDTNGSIRCVTTALLAGMGSDAAAAVEALIESLKAPDRGLPVGTVFIRAGDLRADGRFGLTAQDWKAANRGQAVWALGRIGPAARAAVPSLTRLLESDDEVLRRVATEALVRIEEHPDGEDGER